MQVQDYGHRFSLFPLGPSPQRLFCQRTQERSLPLIWNRIQLFSEKTSLIFLNIIRS